MKIIAKNLLLLLFITTLTSLTTISTTTISKSSSYVGKWKGEDKGDIGFLTLDDEGYASFDSGGQIMGGKSYNHQGVKASMRYEINENVTPYSIDFIIIDLTQNVELGRLQGVVKLIEDDKLRMAIGFGGLPRPTDFTKDAIIFNRVIK